MELRPAGTLLLNFLSLQNRMAASRLLAQNSHQAVASPESFLRVVQESAIWPKQNSCCDPSNTNIDGCQCLCPHADRGYILLQTRTWGMYQLLTHYPRQGRERVSAPPVVDETQLFGRVVVTAVFLCYLLGSTLLLFSLLIIL